MKPASQLGPEALGTIRWHQRKTAASIPTATAAAQPSMMLIRGSSPSLGHRPPAPRPRAHRRATRVMNGRALEHAHPEDT
jgi:hypothetical protein